MCPSCSLSINEAESSASDKAQDFHSIALLEASTLEVLAIEDFQIQLHGDPFGRDLQLAQQIADCRAQPAIARLSVDLDLHGVSHGLSS
jgi:hypothetical protein